MHLGSHNDIYTDNPVLLHRGCNAHFYRDAKSGYDAVDMCTRLIGVDAKEKTYEVPTSLLIHAAACSLRLTSSAGSLCTSCWKSPSRSNHPGKTLCSPSRRSGAFGGAWVASAPRFDLPRLAKLALSMLAPGCIPRSNDMSCSLLG